MVNSTNNTAPATVEFNADATGGSPPYFLSWNFGDGINSTGVGENITHTFTRVGDYNITLSAKDSGTPSQNATANVLVTITSPANSTVRESLTTTILANSTNNTAPATVEFNADATGGSPPYFLSRNFGDGINSTGVGENITHTFTRVGDYNITLSAKDSGTPSQNATANVLVTITSPANSTVRESLTTTILVNSTNNTAPATVEFNADATGGSPPYFLNWNFGDGINSTGVGERASHTFTRVGDYNITLSAKDSGTPSQNATANVLVTITSPANSTELIKTELKRLATKIDVSNTNSTAPATVEFNADATGGSPPYFLSWNFGDGINSTGVGERASHTFTRVGDYNITLSAKDSVHLLKMRQQMYL